MPASYLRGGRGRGCGTSGPAHVVADAPRPMKVYEMPETPETPAPSPQLLRLQAVAREAAATLVRVEGKLERFDAKITRSMGDLRDEIGGPRGEVAGFVRDLRIQSRVLTAVSLASLAGTVAVLGRGFGWW